MDNRRAVPAREPSRAAFDPLPPRTMRASFRSCLRLLPILAVLLAAREALAVDHDILWKRISGQCLPNYQARESYSPCAFVDTAHGYVLYKVDRDPYQYLLLPSERITGIEDPRLAAPGTPNYFWYAWQARALLAEKLGKPLRETDIALTVNAENARTQNQLHIHISCLEPKVRAMLDTLETGKLGDGWFALPGRIGWHSYMARKIDAAELAHTDPFALVREKLAAEHEPLAYTGVALVKLDARRFLVLAATGNALLGVPAEEMQDHRCSIAG
ncbi:CDP-diacylglycerol diphosphatase [Burkholderia sp. Cy-637]|nr:CDP-diacylglycerol diphosphatase [Burkholderia sp. Cy-637]